MDDHGRGGRGVADGETGVSGMVHGVMACLSRIGALRLSWSLGSLSATFRNKFKFMIIKFKPAKPIIWGI